MTSSDGEAARLRRKQIRITSVEQGVRLAFQALSFLGLARALDAAEFGSAAVVLAVVNFVYMIGQLGVEAAVIREHLPSDELASLSTAVATINLMLGLLLVGVGALLGPTSDGKALALTAAAAIGLPLWAAGAIPRARLLQAGRFTAVAIGGIAGSAMNAAAVLVLTIWSNAAWVALLSSSIAIGSSAAIYYFSAERTGWGRLRRPRPSVLKFVAHVSIFNSINYVARNGDTVIIAAVLGASAAGSYDRAYAMTLYPLTAASQVVGRVSYIWFVEAFKGGTTRSVQRSAETSSLRAISLTTMLSTPPLLVLCVFSGPIVQQLFRASMAGTSAILAILALGAVAQAWQQPTGQLLQAAGRTEVLYKRGGWYSALHIPALVIGLGLGGLNGAAVGLAVYSWASTPLVWGMACRAVGLSGNQLFRSCGIVIIAAFGTLPVAVLLRTMVNTSSLLYVGCACLAATGIGLLLSLAASKTIRYRDAQ